MFVDLCSAQLAVVRQLGRQVGKVALEPRQVQLEEEGALEWTEKDGLGRTIQR